MEHRKRRNQQGASFVEYALVLSLIAIASIAILQFIGANVTFTFSAANAALN